MNVQIEKTVEEAKSTIAVVLVNLGTPDAPNAPEVRRYLKQFLSDPRVVEIPRFLWQIILRGFILPFRPKQSAKKYAAVWMEQGSPLRVYTEKQVTLLKQQFADKDIQVIVKYAMRYGTPAVADVLSDLEKEGVDRILVFPAYPQYSCTTTASVYDAVFQHYETTRNIPELRFIKHYHDHPRYIDALKKQIEAYWAVNGQPDKLLMSFHGVPLRTQLLGDPYQKECLKTAQLLVEALGLEKSQYQVTFQSRFGKAKWLQPYTANTLAKLGKEGVKRVDVVCPGFISDCLETLEEINMEGKQTFLSSGGKEFHLIPCLNDSPAWGKASAEIALLSMSGWPIHSRQYACETEKECAD